MPVKTSRPQSASALLRGPPLTLSDIIRQGLLQQVRDLVDLGMDINSRDSEGKTPLMLCGLVEPEKWGIGIARHLIENDADLSLRDKSGRNALHHACIYQRYGLTKVFLSAIDFDLNETDRYGNTALHYAVKSGNIKMIKLMLTFLKKYGMHLHTVNKAGLTALDVAHKASIKHPECVQLLETAMKPPSEKSDEKQEEDTQEEKKDEGNEKGQEKQSSEHLELTELNLKSFCDEQKPKPPMAKAPLLKRRRESVSSTSSMSSGSRLPSRRSLKSSYRSTNIRQTARQNDKNAENIIRCASLSDFRNTKEYVFKLTAFPYDELDPQRSLPSIRRPQSSWTLKPESAYQAAEPYSWRTEFKKLYVEYEYQCSSSWRDAAKPVIEIPPPVLTPPPPLEEEEEKMLKESRRGRRGSMTPGRGLGVESRQDRRRSSAKGRKLSNSSASGSPTAHSKSSAWDSPLGDSSESLNSSNSSKKKDGGVGAKNVASSSDKDAKPLQIPAVTETLVGDSELEDASKIDSHRLSVLSDIDEDANKE